MSEHRNVDPRFDPAFQRGYQPAPQAPAPAAGPWRLTPSDDALDLGVDPAYGPAAAEVAPAATAVASRPATGLIAQADPKINAERIDEEPEEGASRRPNPFLIALAAVSVLLIGGGFSMFARIAELYSNEATSPFDWATAQSLTVAAPMLIALGVATAIGVLFVFAVRWKSPR